MSGDTEPTAAAIEKEDPSGVNADREVRADIIKKANEADADTAKAEQAAADAASKPIKTPRKTKTSEGKPAKNTAQKRTAPQHVVKRDDAGAKEQQAAARRNAVPALLADLEGPPVVAPIIEKGLKGKFKIVRREEATEEIKDELFVLLDGRIIGDGFPHPGEIIIDVRREDGQDHQRFSTFTHDGRIDVGLMGISGPGTWLFHAEAQVTQVGEGRDDHLPVIRESPVRKLIVR